MCMVARAAENGANVSNPHALDGRLVYSIMLPTFHLLTHLSVRLWRAMGGQAGGVSSRTCACMLHKFSSSCAGLSLSKDIYYEVISP